MLGDAERNFSFQLNTLQRNVFQWFHESEIPANAFTPILPLRQQVMADLHSRIEATLQSQEELVQCQLKFQVLCSLIVSNLQL